MFVPNEKALKEAKRKFSQKKDNKTLLELLKEYGYKVTYSGFQKSGMIVYEKTIWDSENFRLNILRLEYEIGIVHRVRFGFINPPNNRIENDNWFLIKDVMMLDEVLVANTFE